LILSVNLPIACKPKLRAIERKISRRIKKLLSQQFRRFKLYPLHLIWNKALKSSIDFHNGRELI
jgi:hypothetical protein